MTSCDICVEGFNQTTRKRIECPSCRLCVCVECVERYCATQQDLIEITCMKCKRAWDYEFLVKVSRSFVNRQKARVETSLIELERVKLPETQFYLQYDRAIDTHVREEINRANNTLYKLNDEIHDLVENEQTVESMSLPEISNKYYDLSQDIRRVKRRIYRLNKHVEDWKYGLRMTYTKYIPESLQNNKGPTIKCSHVCPCSVDGCSGFVMEWNTEQNACGTCHTKYCKECNQPHADGHTCDPQDVASAREIVKSSKPCPSCAVRIQKIEGCDQMWCTQCKTAFSWTTGQIEQNAVHNPHFFEWFANNVGNNEQETPEICERLNNRRPNQIHLMTHCTVLFGVDTDLYRHFTELFRLSVHVQYVEMDQHFSRTDLERNHLDLRLRWLKNDITLKRLGNVLYKRHKEVLVNVRRRQVLQILVTASNDIFSRLMYHCKNETDALKLQQESHALIEYVNDCFKELRDAYRMKMPIIRFGFPHGQFETCGFMGFLPMTNVFS